MGKEVSYKFPSAERPHAPLVIPVLSHANNKQNRDVIRMTWGGRNAAASGTIGGGVGGGANVLFLVAGPWANVKDEFNGCGDLFWLDMEENYEKTLTFKVQSFLAALGKHPGYSDFANVLKTDDDSFVSIAQLGKELKKNEGTDYWGWVWKSMGVNRDPTSASGFVSPENFPLRDPDRFPKYCSGQGYVLSRRLVQCMVRKSPDAKFIPFEDAFTGVLAEQCGSSPVANEGIRPSFEKKTGQQPKVVDTFHQKTLEMIQTSFQAEQKETDKVKRKKAFWRHQRSDFGGAIAALVDPKTDRNKDLGDVIAALADPKIGAGKNGQCVVGKIMEKNAEICPPIGSNGGAVRAGDCRALSLGINEETNNLPGGRDEEYAFEDIAFQTFGCRTWTFLGSNDQALLNSCRERKVSPFHVHQMGERQCFPDGVSEKDGLLKKSLATILQEMEKTVGEKTVGERAEREARGGEPYVDLLSLHLRGEDWPLVMSWQEQVVFRKAFFCPRGENSEITIQFCIYDDTVMCAGAMMLMKRKTIAIGSNCTPYNYRDSSRISDSWS